MDVSWGNFLGRGHALQNQNQRAAGGADVDRLVTRIQNQHGPVKPIRNGHQTLLVFH
jgi:hypothetical protein